ncbi:MAG: TIGR00725 family protein [Bacteroidales bacterium]|nr:TIGR00725 family protein [Bacteroidales bacterium]
MRPIIGIIGAGEDLCTKKMYNFGLELGHSLLAEGYRIVTGGKSGIMEAVSRGGMNSESYFEGSIIGILPEENKNSANDFCDIVIPTGFGINRNSVIINTADVIIAIGGGSGTLSEIAFAWQKNKKVLCVEQFEGWSGKLAGETLDNRNKDILIGVNEIEEIIDYLRNLFSRN